MRKIDVIILILMGLGAIALLTALGLFFVMGSRTAPGGPAPTPEAALGVLAPELFAECHPEGITGSYKSCVVEISRDAAGWKAAVTYDGLYDDSLKASRLEVHLKYSDGRWIAQDEIVHTNQCYPGRGHQDFTTELCV